MAEKSSFSEPYGLVQSQTLPGNDVELTRSETTEPDPKEINQALRKADLRILPLLTVLYIFSFMGMCGLNREPLKVLSFNTPQIDPTSEMQG